jgi:hypothetical protein
MDEVVIQEQGQDFDGGQKPRGRSEKMRQAAHADSNPGDVAVPTSWDDNLNFREARATKSSADAPAGRE